MAESLGEAVLELRADIGKLDHGLKQAESKSDASAKASEAAFAGAARGIIRSFKDAGDDVERSVAGARQSAERDADKMAGAFDGASDKMERSVQDGADGMEESLGGVAGKARTVALGVAAAFGGAQIIEAFDDSASASGRLQARLGLNTKEARTFDRVATQVYRNNFGESMTQAADVVGLVHQALGLQGKELRQTTEDVFALSDAFEDQGAETQIITDGLRAMKQAYPGQSEKRLLDQIAHAFQTGAGTAGDLQDTLQEYPAHFKAIGLNSRDMLTWLTLGMENGARNTDFLADAVKEFGIRVKTAGDTGQQALRDLFPDSEAQRLENAFARGGNAGRDAFYEVLEALAETENKQDRYNLAVELFGTKAEDMVGVLDRMTPAFLRSRDATDDAKGAADKLDEQYTGIGNTIEGLKRALITDLEPAFDRINRIMSRKDLSAEEKFDAVLDEVSDLARRGAPKAVKAGAKIGAAILRGVADAVLEGDALTRLFVGAAALKLFGGSIIFRRLGERMGKTTSRGFAVGLLLGLPLVLPEAFEFGEKIGEKIRKPIIKAIDFILGGVSTMLGTLADAWDKVPFADGIARDLRSAQGEIDLFREKARFAMDELKTPGDVQDALRKGFITWDQASEKLKKMGRSAGQAHRDIHEALVPTGREFSRTGRKATDFAGDVEKGVRNVTRDVRKTERSVDRDTDKTGKSFDRLGGRSKTAFSRVGRNAGSLADAVAKGLDNIKRNTDKSLKAYGVKELGFSISAVGESLGTLFRQRGGPIQVPGTGTGDIVDAMVPPNWFVLNSRASQALGFQEGGSVPVKLEPKETLWPPELAHIAAMANSLIPRFQRGGAPGGLSFALGPYDMPPIKYAADHAGGNSHVHITGTTTPWVVAIGRKLQQMGFMVGEHPAFGGVQGGHSPTGGHYDALAIDVNSAADETRSEVAQIARLLGGAGGALVDKIKRVLLEGPDGPLKSMGQGALDKVGGAANRFIGSQTPDIGVEPSGGLGKTALTGLWRRANNGLGNANLMAAIALAESSGNPDVTNSIGARGLWQIIPSTARAFGLDYGRLTDPLYNAKGAGAILSGQGLGAWEAYTNGNYRQYLARGGIVGKLIQSVGDRSKFRKLLARLKPSGGDYAGLSPKQQDRIEHLFGLSAEAEEFAGRASSLTREDADGNPIAGEVGGKEEAEWLQVALNQLFALRNVLIRAQQEIEERQALAEKQLQQARKRLADLDKKIKREKSGFTGGLLGAAGKLKGVSPKAARALRERLRQMRSRRDALAEKIIPRLQDQRTTLIATGDLLGDDLEQVHGLGSPGGVMTKWPALGVLGGRIFDAQMRIRDLGQTESEAPAPPPEERSFTIDGLEELLQAARYGVFNGQLPPFGGSFADGGVVPGPVGAPRTIVAHGGEEITPPGSGGKRMNMKITNWREGTGWVEEIADGVAEQRDRADHHDARTGVRG